MQCSAAISVKHPKQFTPDRLIVEIPKPSGHGTICFAQCQKKTTGVICGLHKEKILLWEDILSTHKNKQTNPPHNTLLLRDKKENEIMLSMHTKQDLDITKLPTKGEDPSIQSPEPQTHHITVVSLRGHWLDIYADQKDQEKWFAEQKTLNVFRLNKKKIGIHIGHLISSPDGTIPNIRNEKYKLILYTNK